MDEWENMLYFATEMLNEAKRHKSIDIINQRIAIVHLDHATELLMKSFLLREGYSINIIDKDKVNKGIKSHYKIKQLLHKDKTISFHEVLDLVSNLISLNSDYKGEIKKFHKIRNEVQHRALALPLNKLEAIENFTPALKDLYAKMFPNLHDVFSDFEKN